MNYFTKEEEKKIKEGFQPVLSHKDYLAGGRGQMDNLIGWAKTDTEALEILKADCNDLEEGIEVIEVDEQFIEYKDSAKDQNCQLQRVYLPVYMVKESV